jgi:hypothetical protein
VIKYGHIDNFGITHDQMSQLNFDDYFQCYQQTPAVEQYYTEHNSSIWQMFETSPQWVHDLSKKIPQDFDHHVVSVINIPPGQTIPYHVDKHFKLKQKHNDDGTGVSHRYLIFLEDWKRGHYYEVHDQPFVKWRAGDWVKFGIDDWHIAGNMGEEPFYSCQVTVLKDA